MPYEIVESSPLAKELAKSPKTRKSASKYDFPFASLTPGTSFAIDHSQVANGPTLRTLVYRQAKKLNKRLVVINHKEIGKYEIAELPK